MSKERYTLSVKLSDFTAWCHIWRRNWVTAQFWQAVLQTSELSFLDIFHAQNFPVHLGNPTFSSVYLPTPRSHHLKAHQFPAIHSADEHRMRYILLQVSLLTLQFTLSFRITLWPMWLANSKRQPYFYPLYSHAQEDTQNWQKTDKKLTDLMGNLCCAR